MANQKENQPATELIKAFQESNQAIVYNIISGQERNIEFMQQFFAEGMEILKASQTAAASIVEAQERTAKFAQSFFAEGIEIMKANQAAAESIASAQEHAAKFAQNFFAEGMKVLKANQTVAENISSVQESNLKFTQNFFSGGMETLKTQAESAQTLIVDLQQKAQEQQMAFQNLTKESMEAYLRFFSNPLAFYQQMMEAAQTTAQQGMESAKKAKKPSGNK